MGNGFAPSLQQRTCRWLLTWGPGSIYCGWRTVYKGVHGAGIPADVLPGEILPAGLDAGGAGLAFACRFRRLVSGAALTVSATRLPRGSRPAGLGAGMAPRGRVRLRRRAGPGPG
jgi:hypothetical protein